LSLDRRFFIRSSRVAAIEIRQVIYGLHNLYFPFTGTTLPSDHGYGLYGAISRLIPEAHTADWLSIETISGVARGDGVTQLDPEARLKIRIPQDRVPLMLKLAGKRLEVDGHSIRLGAPQIFLLKPSTTLYARIVTIKGFTEPDPFLDAVCRKLDELGVKGEPVVGPRRVVKVGNHTTVGFARAIHELSDEGSIVLQERGLGGRRRMGCGIFFPIAIDRVIGEPPKRIKEVSK
jgi:CRISPR-associated endonuclease/helicase Cas3